MRPSYHHTVPYVLSLWGLILFHRWSLCFPIGLWCCNRQKGCVLKLWLLQKSYFLSLVNTPVWCWWNIVRLALLPIVLYIKTNSRQNILKAKVQSLKKSQTYILTWRILSGKKIRFYVYNNNIMPIWNQI